mmetsp:Transcript_16928/g.38238  ORF Transcript_16928/g.38238 Transcript_16928/m.38238 type:complete len:201 (-) Transcript_16928:281-883(-)
MMSREHLQSHCGAQGSVLVHSLNDDCDPLWWLQLEDVQGGQRNDNGRGHQHGQRDRHVKGRALSPDGCRRGRRARRLDNREDEEEEPADRAEVPKVFPPFPAVEVPADCEPHCQGREDCRHRPHDAAPLVPAEHLLGVDQPRVQVEVRRQHSHADQSTASSHCHAHREVTVDELAEPVRKAPAWAAGHHEEHHAWHVRHA